MRFGISGLTSCVLDTSTVATLARSYLGSASENDSGFSVAAGTPTFQPNQMLLSAAPTRIVPTLEPVGRCEMGGTCAGSGRTPTCWATPTIPMDAKMMTTV